METIEPGLKELKKQLADAHEERYQQLERLYQLENNRYVIYLNLEASADHIEYLKMMLELKEIKKKRMVETMATYGRDNSTTYEPEETAIEQEDWTQTELDCQ